MPLLRGSSATTRSSLNHTFKEALLQEFDNKCSYCGRPLWGGFDVSIDHFYPLSKYPEKQLDPENILPACGECNCRKANTFPTDESGNPLLLHPRLDNYSEHIAIDENGILVGKTERGRWTIEVLQLNRPSLTEARKVQAIEHAYLLDIKNTPTNPHEIFVGAIKRIRELNSTRVGGDDIQQHFTNLLYANVITTLETYLCDRFILAVTASEEALRNFVESFHDFKQEKFELRELFERYGNIEAKALESMKGVIYHDLPKVSGMYADALKIKFPTISEVYKSVFIRHDIVHRNGKTKDGKTHVLGMADVESLCALTDSFVNSIEAQLV